MGVSNIQRPVGLQPVSDEWTGMRSIAREYYVGGGATNRPSGLDMYTGELVKRIRAPVAGAPMVAPTPLGAVGPQSDIQATKSGQYSTIDVMAVGDGAVPVGVVVGFLYDPQLDKLGYKYLPLSYQGQARLVTDPEALFQATVSGTLTMANCGQNVDITAAAPNQTYGWPGIMVDGTTVANTATLPLIVVRPASLPGNDITQPYAQWYFRLNSPATLGPRPI